MQFKCQSTALPILSIAAIATAAVFAPTSVFAADPATGDEVPCEVVVLNFEPKGLPENEKHVAEILTNTFAAEIAQSANCKVITQNDLKSMTEFESQRQLG